MTTSAAPSLRTNPLLSPLAILLAAIALSIGTVALRNTPLTLKVLERSENRDAALELLREAFDMLEEDYAEERFFATVRRGFWQAAAGSPQRTVAEALIRKLEF